MEEDLLNTTGRRQGIEGAEVDQEEDGLDDVLCSYHVECDKWSCVCSLKITVINIRYS